MHHTCVSMPFCIVRELRPGGVVEHPMLAPDRVHALSVCRQGVQLGPTDASRYWIYWVPAQYVAAIKDTVLGKWQYF